MTDTRKLKKSRQTIQFSEDDIARTKSIRELHQHATNSESFRYALKFTSACNEAGFSNPDQVRSLAQLYALLKAAHERGESIAFGKEAEDGSFSALKTVVFFTL